MSEQDQEILADSGRRLNGSRDILLLVSIYVGIAAIAIASGVFFVLLPSTITETHAILQQQSASYLVVNVPMNATLIYLLSLFVGIGVLLSVYLSVVRPNLHKKTEEKNAHSFFRFFSIFVLLEYLISVGSSLISEGSVPAIYSTQLGVQNFVMSVSSLSELAILQFVPLFAMVGGYLVLRGKFTVSNFLHPYSVMSRDIMIPATVASVFTSAVFSQSVIGAFFNLLVFLFLDYIYLRFGIPQSFIAGFTVSMLGILTAISSSITVSLVSTGFLTFWSLIGMYNALRLMVTKHPPTKKNDEPREEVHPQEPQPTYTNSNLLWIRSTCPNCGTANFYIRENMQLECMNCHHAVDRDASGPANIILEQRRPMMRV